MFARPCSPDRMPCATLLGIVGVLVLLFAAAPLRADQAKHILILNSYHRGYNWTDEQSDGMAKTLTQLHPGATQDVVYMDWKRFPTKDTLDDLAALLRHRYHNRRIDLLLTTDDAALLFALKHRREFLDNAPIVYSGVFERTAKDYTAHEHNVTGVYEAVNPQGTIEAALALNPNYKNVYIVHDSSETSRTLEKEILEDLAGMGAPLMPHVLTGLPFDALCDRLAALPPQSFILLASYAMDSNGLTMQPERFAALMSTRANAPIYTMYDHMLGCGVVGGSLLAGSLQGEAAGRLGAQILQGIPAGSLPPINRKTVFYGFAYDQLQRFSLPLSRLPPDSRIVGRPFSFFREYQALVLTATAVFGLLLALVCLLACNIRRRRRVEAALRQSENKLRNIFDRAPAGFLLFDQATTILDCNAAMEQLFGVPKERYLQANLLEIMPDSPFRSGLIRALETGSSSTEGPYMSTFSGKVAYIKTLTTRIEEGVYLCILEDFTERQRAQEALRLSEERFRKLAEGSSAVLWEYAPATDAWTYLAPQVERILGFAPGDWQGLGFLIERLHPDDRERVSEALAAILANDQGQVLEYRFRRRDGEIVWLHDEIVAEARRSGPPKLRGLMLDITLRRRSEEQMAKAAAMAEASSRAKSEFLANMSHEIRTPLSGIQGMLQLLGTTALDAEQTTYVGNALRSSRRLTDLLSDILDLSRIEAGKLAIVPVAFSLEALRASVMELFRATAGDKKLAFDFLIDDGMPPVLIGDELRLRQILCNLVGNALKFTEDGFVRVEARALPVGRSDRRHVFFCVSDSGIGMSEALLADVFEPFIQGEGAYTRRFQGAGLGLAIVKKLVRAMDGELALESVEGQGTTVYLSLPFQVPAPAAADSPS